MKRKKILKMLAVLMAIATVVYVGTEVYAYKNSKDRPQGGIAYGVEPYEGERPSKVYTPEELGAVDFIFYYYTDIPSHIIVPPGKEPFPLQEVQPVFEYKGKLYRVSALWAAYPVPPNLPQQPVGAVSCGIGWCITGILWLKWRKEDETTN